MSALGVYNPTLLDLANKMDPNGTIGMVAEILTQQNEILLDAAVREGNLPTGHQSIIRTGIGGATWKKMYGYIQPDKSTTAKVIDSCGMLRRYSEVDVDLARMSGDVQAFVLSEAKPALEAMNQEMASTLIYGNESTEPEAFTGFAPRYNDQSAENARNILTSAATPDNTDNTSIWLIEWGDDVFLTTPKGSSAGLKQQDFGEVGKTDSNGAILQVYRSLFSWDLGLVVKDWRRVVRINYDLEDIVANAATGPDLRKLMSQAIRRLPPMGTGRRAFYMNLDSLDAFDLQTNGNPLLAFKSVEDAQGREMSTFRGIPVRRVDAILSTEAGI